MLAVLLSFRVWIAAAVLALVIAIGFGWSHMKDWLLARAEVKQTKENAQVLKDSAQALKDGAETKKAVEDLKAQRVTITKRANTAAAEKKRLVAVADKIEQDRVKVPAPKTLQEAADALRKMGY